MKRIVCLLCAVFLALGLLPELTSKSEAETERWFGTTISAGDFHISAIKNDGSLWVWGTNCYGALGSGKEEDSFVPIKIMDDVSSTISGSSAAYAAIKTNGELWNWGLHGNYGRLGREAEGRYLKPGKLMDHIRMADIGSGHSAALTEDGTLWLWGQNTHGELGNGRTGALYQDQWHDVLYEPLPFKAMTNVKAVETGKYNTFVIDDENRLWAWGSNSFGELGNGKTGNETVELLKGTGVKELIQTTPVMIMEDVASVDSFENTAIIKTDGSLWICGTGWVDDRYEICYDPRKVMDNVICAAAGSGGDFAAVKADGSLWTWSGLFSSALGIGEDSEDFQPDTPVKIMDDVVSVTAGWMFMGALKSDGSLWTWGNNACGQLGTGDQEEVWKPVKVMDGVALPTMQTGGLTDYGAGSKGKQQTAKTNGKAKNKQSSKASGCTVRFDAGKGTCKVRSKKGVFAQPYGELPTPTLKGQDFAGWYTEPTGGDRIFSYSVVINQNDHTLYAHWDTSNGKPSVSELSYKFANSQKDFHYPDHYRIPIERYTRFFDPETAQRYYNLMGEWGGNCYGMCATSSMLFCENGTEPSDFRKGAKSPIQLSLSDYSKEIGMNLNEFIESAHILQMTSSICRTKNRNVNAYYSLGKAVQNFAKTGKDPVIISIRGPRKPDGSRDGHALIGYKIGRIKNKKKDAILVYDPIYPSDDNRYIELYWDTPGYYTGWRYQIFKNEAWGSDYDGEITFQKYSDFYSVWNSQQKEKAEGSILRLKTDSATVYDYSGNAVAEVRDGAVTTYRTDVYPMETVNGSDENDPDGYTTTLWLPTDYYVVKNTDSEAKQLDFSLYNGEQDISVSTTSDTVLCYSNVEDEANMVYVGGQNEAYEVVFTAEKDGKESTTTLAGITSEDIPTSIGKLSGTLYSTGVSLDGVNKLEIDGRQGEQDDLQSSSLIYMVTSSEPKAEETVFTDVPGDSIYMPAIQWVWQNNIMEETSLGLFSPDAFCTTEEMLEAVWRALGMPLAEEENGSKNGSDAARWARESGYRVKAEGKDACSVGDVLFLLWQVHGEPGKENEIPGTKNAILWANGLKAIPDESMYDRSIYTDLCTRAELARILYIILSL